LARYKDAVCRLCRREGMKLFLKGPKCFTDKCPVEKRNFAPGQHGKDRKAKVVGYGLQLREKQKARRIYGVLERQFRRHFEEASRSGGSTGDKLIEILESRLDNVVYRMGFASNRNKARQLVNHGHFRVNGRKVSIPSAMVKVGDVVSVKDLSRELAYFKDLPDEMASRDMASWVEVDVRNLSGKMTRLPGPKEAQPILSEQLIVEHYSRRI